MLAAFFACIAWALAVRFAWWGEWTFGSDRREIALAPALLGWLVIWVPIIVATQALLATESRWMAERLHRLARPALSGLILSLSIATWLSEPLGTLQFWTSADSPHRNWFVLWPLLGAATAVFAAMCAFRVRNRGLLGVAMAGALLHVAQFYFLLGFSLLMKSIIMIALGGVLLVCAHLQRQPEPAAGDAT
jgi:hypothetical protein